RCIERDVAKPAVEIAVVGRAAEFTVGRELQADALLQPHGVFDGAIFGCGERDLIDLARCKAAPCFEQRRRPQQAADVLRAEGRWAQRCGLKRSSRACVMVASAYSASCASEALLIGWSITTNL